MPELDENDPRHAEIIDPEDAPEVVKPATTGVVAGSDEEGEGDDA
jgi:hypothetical protein